MDPFHERLARVALEAAGSYGFALAGGYAVQAHGFLNRMSADVDLFAEASGKFDFSEAVDAVISAYRRDGLAVEAEVLTASFARLNVKSAADHDPGFDRSWFAEALNAIDRLSDRLFEPYNLSPEDTAALKARMRAWADRIGTSR